MSNKKIALQNIQFTMVGFLLLASGMGIVVNQVLSYALMALGGLLLIFSLYSLIRRKENFTLKLLALCCESIGLFATSFVLFSQGSKYLPFVYLAGGFAIFVGVIIHFRKRKKIVPVKLN